MEELDLKELLNIFWIKRVAILIIIMIFTGIGAIYSYCLVTPKYKSSTTLVLAKAEPNGAEANNSNNNNAVSTESITQTEITLNQKLISTYSEVVKSKNVLRQVINNLNLKNLEEDELKRNVTVSSVKDTELIEITVTNENAEYAHKIANEVAKVFTQKVAEVYNINNVHVLDEAEVANSPCNVNHMKDIVIFVFIGVVIASMYVLISNMLDNTIKTVEDIEKKMKLPVLAVMPVYDFNSKGGKKK